ncbi:MAG: peroxiredoxin family protein [Woeseia sp.]
MRSGLAGTAVLLTLFVAVGCSRDRPAAGPAKLQTGYWRASISLPGGDIETGIEIGHDGVNYTATLINGQERVRIDEVGFSDGRLLLRFPAFNNEIDAMLEDGRLVGSLTLVRRFGKKQILPFVAAQGVEITHTEDFETDTIDLSGRWAVQFHNDDGTSNVSVGEFAQRGSRLFGTFLNPTADYRFLSGHVQGDEFHLATFDGANAFIFAGKVNDGVITAADFWSGTEFHQTWSAVRDPGATLPDAYKLTYLNSGFDRFDFEFPNLDGRPVSLTDEQFKGKVVVVTITGTWCPNCHDEARLFAPLFDEYRDRGLEVVALMYEHVEDRQIAIEQIRKFREKFDVQYETLLAGISDKTEVSRTLPSLSAVIAFPTTIFIDRNGKVRVIHTGFTGPGTGKYYEQLRQEITALILELIDEQQET